MKLIVWNIQKITQKKAAQFATRIGEIIVGIVGNEPFIFVVLENKTRPEKTLNAIGTGLRVADLKFLCIDTGGSKSLKEYILIFSGNGATFTAEPFILWRELFDQRCRAMHEQEIQQATLEMQRLTERWPGRSSTDSLRQKRLADVQQGSFRPAEVFRNPVSITAQFDGETIRFLALHAPGPDSGKEHEHPFAVVFAQSVLQSAYGFAIVLGDFNVRSTMSYIGEFVDMGVRTGATTKGKEDGRHTYSRLDRSYCRRGTPVVVELFTDGPGDELTDHHCLVVSLQKRAQRLIPDYFAYEPSPIRRQAIRRTKREEAEQRRIARRKERHETIESARHEARQALFNQKRGLEG